MAAHHSYGIPRVLIRANSDSRRRGAPLRDEECIPGRRVVVKKTKDKNSKRKTRSKPEPGYANLSHNESEATLAYIHRVRDIFQDKPEVYQEFVRIMSRIQEDDVNLMDIINKVIVLFDGYPDLIFSFESFLPDGYEIELQNDAVVVKVYEPTDGEDSGRGLYKSDLDGTVDYIKGVKKTFLMEPKVYNTFMGILEKYHCQEIKELQAIRRVVELFRGHINLILGFNEFLPPGYKIHMYETNSFTIEHRDDNGERMTTKIFNI